MTQTYTSPRYISLVDTAKLVRKELKNAFPGIKFSVTCRPGGSSISIHYTDGPSEEVVNSTVSKFTGSTFDGMYDSTTYHHSEYEGETVHFGANFVHATRSMSFAFVEAILIQFCGYWNISPLPPIKGTAEKAYIDTYSHPRFDYGTERRLNQLLRQTDAKDMNNVYGERKTEEPQAQPKAKAQPIKETPVEKLERQYKETLAKADKLKSQIDVEVRKAQEQEARERKAEQERMENIRKARAQQEEDRRKREEAHARYEKTRKEQQDAWNRRQQQQAPVRKRVAFATREDALRFLNLSINTTDSATIKKAFITRVKNASDGRGGYTEDMDLLTKAKEKALEQELVRR